MHSVKLLGCVAISLFLSWSLPIGWTTANGGKGKKTLYEGTARIGDEGEHGEILFSAELERVLFAINSVGSKYKVVRVKIVNASEKALSLSREADKVEFVFGDERVAGILDLAGHDQRLWDSFDDEIRHALAYPAIVEDGEEENVFFFLAKPESTQLPDAVRFTIDALPSKEIMIRQRELVVKR